MEVKEVFANRGYRGKETLDQRRSTDSDGCANNLFNKRVDCSGFGCNTCRLKEMSSFKFREE